MGTRFRRSIKIAPGVRMNVGKRGIGSFSVGKTNFGSRGIYQNFNVPGTGFTYRAKVVGGASNKTSKTKAQAQKPSSNTKIQLILHHEDGSVELQDMKGNPLPQSIARKVKSQNRPIIESFLEQECEKHNGEVESMINLHIHTPKPSGEIDWNPQPIEPELKKYGPLDSLLSKRRKKIEEENERLQEQYNQAMQHWEYAKKGIYTDVDLMASVLESALSSIEWPRETLISFDIVDKGKKVLLDVDLPEVEDMPTTKANVNKRQLKLTVKDRSQSQIRQEYVRHIFAIAFRLIGDIFAFLPASQEVIFSGYSQRPDKSTGHIKDDYLLSVKVNRSDWERLNFSSLELIDPVECLSQYEVRWNATKTGVISAIEPLEE